MNLNPLFAPQCPAQTGLSGNVSWVDFPCIDSGAYHPTVKNIQLAWTENALTLPSCNDICKLHWHFKVRKYKIVLSLQHSLNIEIFVYIHVKKKKSSLYLSLGPNFWICLKLVKNLQVLFIVIWARNQNHLCLNTVAILCTAQGSDIFCYTFFFSLSTKKRNCAEWVDFYWHELYKTQQCKRNMYLYDKR